MRDLRGCRRCMRVALLGTHCSKGGKGEGRECAKPEDLHDILTMTDGLFGILEINTVNSGCGATAPQPFCVPEDKTGSENEKEKEQMTKKRILSWLLILCMMVPLIPLAQAVGTPSETLLTAKEKTVNYYKTTQEGVLADWWELVAIKEAGENLEDYVLPQTPATAALPTDYAGILLGELTKGRAKTALAAELAAKQTADGHFGISYPNQQAWAMLALDRMGVSYNTDSAVAYLLSYQLPDGGFGYSPSDPAGDPDVSAMAAMALASHMGNPDVVGAVDRIKNFFITTQTSTGGYASWGSENSASIATVISGLLAIGEDPATIRHGVSGKSPVDALLAYQMDNGAFQNSITDGVSNAFATKQAALALMDLTNNRSAFATLTQNSTEYISAAVSIRSAGVLPVEEKVTVGSLTNLESTADKAWEKGGNSTTFPAGDYKFYLNSIERPATATLTTEEATLSLIEKTVTTLASFDRQKVTLGMKEAVTLTLTGTPAAGGATSPIANATITINGADYGGYPNQTDANGKITLSFWEAGTFTISAKSPSGQTISKPLCTTSVTALPPYTKTVSVRVEGSGQNIINRKNLTLSSSGEKILTAMDALKESLGATPSSISGGYISSIGADIAGQFSEDYDGWQYLVNGQQPSVGADRQELAGGDEILFYYGGMSSTWYPTMQKEERTDGSLRLTFTATVTEYDAFWNPIVSQKAIAGAAVKWGTNIFTTDGNGQVTILPLQVTPGYHSLQIEKYHPSGLPLVVRLAPDYRVLVEDKITLTGLAPTADLTGKSKEVPVRVTIESGVQNPSLQLAFSAELPEITTVGGAAPLWIAPNTIVTGETGWNGIFALPQNKTVSLSGKTVTFAIGVGSGDNTLSFSRPVRLVLAGSAGKTVGAIDKNGTLTEITALLPADTIEAAESLLTTGSPVAYLTVGSDVVVWAKISGTFTAYTQDSTPPPQPDRVTLSVYGYGGTGLVSPKQVILQDGDTPLSILLRESGLDVQTDGAYVSRIGAYEEFGYGEGSGWMYEVDGVAPSSTGANVYLLQDGQNVAWCYTTNLGEDIGASYTKPILPEAGTLKAEGNVLIGGFTAATATASDGTVSAAIDQSQITDALTRAKEAKKTEDQQLGVLIVLNETKADSKIKISLDKNIFDTLQREKVARLTIESRGAKIRLNQEAIAALYKEEGAQIVIGVIPSTSKEGRPEFEITITSGTQTISSASEGGIVAALSYPLSEGETEGSILVSQLGEGERLTPIANSRYENGWVLFEMGEPGHYQITSRSSTFLDTKSHWGKDSIDFLFGRGLVSGKEEEKFAPDDTITRAEFLKILYGVYGPKEEEIAVEESPEFIDVAPEDWYSPYVMWGAEAGLVLGAGEGTFGPNNPITREQVSVILQKVSTVYNRELVTTVVPEEDFSDGGAVSSWAKEAVEQMKDVGIITGREDNCFDPAGVATRAEGAAMLKRFIENPLRL